MTRLEIAPSSPCQGTEVDSHSMCEPGGRGEGEPREEGKQEGEGEEGVRRGKVGELSVLTSSKLAAR